MAEEFINERTKRCLDLMKPEYRKLVDLPLDEKIKKSQEIIKEAIAKYPRIGLGFSGGTDSLVLLHLALPFYPTIPAVFVNTLDEFPETFEFIEKVRKEWKVNLTTVQAPQKRFDEFITNYGLKTPAFTKVCCDYHKITPMMKAIDDMKFDAFMVGLRGVEHEERAQESIYSPRKTHIRVHPLLFWKQKDILDYVKKFNITCNPLYSQGYTSLGCIQCTSKNLDKNAHERSGRGEVREMIMKSLRDLGYT
jgi:phosphoadenosine phosphosulfate reductase